MPLQNPTRLSIVMEMLFLSCTRLAESIHVDRTLVSRWKNGRLNLSPKSQHFRPVVLALAQQNRELGQRTLEGFFQSTLGVQAGTKSEMECAIGRWLTDDGAPPAQASPKADCQSMYRGEINVYKGEAGKRKAILHLMEALCRMPDGQTVVLYDLGAGLFQPKNVLSPPFQRCLRRLAQKNCRFEIILFLNKQQDDLHRLYELLLPIIGAVSTIVRYVYQPSTSTFDFAYYVKDRMVLLGKGAEKQADIYAGIVQDYLTVEALGQHMTPLLAQADPLITEMVDEPLHRVLSGRPVRELASTPSDQYVIGEDIGLLAEACLGDEQVMMELNLTSAETHLARTYTNHKNQNLKKLLYGKARTRVVLDLEHLRGLKGARRMEIPALSELLGRPVWVASHNILRQLWLFWSRPAGKVELAFRPRDTAPFCPGVNVWVKRDALLCFHQHIRPGTRILISEFSSVNRYYERAFAYWQGLPKAAKQRDYIGRQLALLLS